MTKQKPIQSWLGVTADKYKAVFKAIETGEIENFDRPKLLEYARYLAAYHTDHAAQDQTAAALLIHNLQVSRTLEEIDQSNRYVQRLVIFLAILTVIASCLQTYFTIFPRKRATVTLSSQAEKGKP